MAFATMTNTDFVSWPRSFKNDTILRLQMDLLFGRRVLSRNKYFRICGSLQFFIISAGSSATKTREAESRMPGTKFNQNLTCKSIFVDKEATLPHRHRLQAASGKIGVVCKKGQKQVRFQKRWYRKKESFQVLRSEDPCNHAHVPEPPTQLRETESVI